MRKIITNDETKNLNKYGLLKLDYLKKNNKILIIKLSSILLNRFIFRILNNIKFKNILKKIPNYIEFDLNNFFIIFNLTLMNQRYKNSFIKNILLNNNNINIIKYHKNKSLKLNKIYKNL